MKRFEQWPRLLSDYIADCKKKPFEWGQHDCLLFAGGAVKALTGVDFCEQYKGYSTEQEAIDIVSTKGGIEALISSHLGHEGSRNIMTARRGDIVVFKMPDKTAGIVDDSGESIVFLTREGIRRIPLKKAWRVWSY